MINLEVLIKEHVQISSEVFVSFHRLDCCPGEYDMSNKTSPITQTSPLYLVNNVSKDLKLNKRLKY